MCRHFQDSCNLVRNKTLLEKERPHRVNPFIRCLAFTLLASSILLPAASGALSSPVSGAHLRGPTALELTSDGKYAYVGTDLSESIIKIRTDDMVVVAAADLSEYWPLGCWNLALDVAEQKLFAYSNTWRKLLVLDAGNLQVIHSIDDIDLVGMERSRDGRSLLTWNGGGTITVIDTGSYQLSQSIHQGMFFTHISQSLTSSGVWFVLSGGPGAGGEYRVGSYDPAGKKWIRSVLLPIIYPEGPNELKVLPGERKAYVSTISHWGTGQFAFGSLDIVDFAAGTVKVLAIDGAAFPLETTLGGEKLYIGTGWPAANDKNLLVLDTATDTLTGEVLLGLTKYGWRFTQMNRLKRDPTDPNRMFGDSSDANAIIKVDLRGQTLTDVLIPSKQRLQPHLFVKHPSRPGGYVLVKQSPYAFWLDFEGSADPRLVKLPVERPDAFSYDIAISPSGTLYIAQGESILEVDESTMMLLATHPLAPQVQGLWSLILSHDGSRIYSVSNSSVSGNNSSTLTAVSTRTFKPEGTVDLPGGVFSDKPFELPDGSKLYALGGEANGNVVVHAIDATDFSIKQTITFSEAGSLGISSGPFYPFVYDSASKTLFVAATYVVLAIDTTTDTVKRIIRLADTTNVPGFPKGMITYTNVNGLVYQASENCLYLAHGDGNYINIFDLNAGSFRAPLIFLKGYFPSFLFAAEGYNKIYSLNMLSDSISVVDPGSKAVVRVIDLGDLYLHGVSAKPNGLAKTLRTAAGLYSPSSNETMDLDVIGGTASGRVTLRDAVLLLRILLGLPY
jgi:YVTN family beta-propeller protein